MRVAPPPKPVAHARQDPTRARAARRRLGLGVLLAVFATARPGEPTPPTDTCVLGATSSAGWMGPLAVTPAFADTRPSSPGGPPRPDELAGEWTGTVTITSARSPMKPVEQAMIPYLGVARDLAPEASASSGGATFAFGDGSWRCPFILSGSTLTCTTQVNGYRMTMTGAVTRAGSALRVTGTWNASQPMITLSGSWTMLHAASDVELELLYLAGRSPKVFTSGWLFGARCVRGKGTPTETDLSAEVAWGGTATFTPARGTPVRPRFATVGANKLTLTCAGAKRTFVVETVQTARFAHLGHRASAPADAHGCPACPHPTAGPIVQGSPTVLIDGFPAARAGDAGVHAACCGGNFFRIAGGNNDGVLIDGRPAVIVGARTLHCGGEGRIIEGSLGGNEPPSPTEASGGGFFGMPGPKAPAARTPTPPRASATTTTTREPPTSADVRLDAPPIEDVRGTTSATLRTEPGTTRVVRNTPDGAASPAAAIALLPSSELIRQPDGAIRLERGGLVVTTLAPAKQLIVTDSGTIELGSQARIALVAGGVDVALLAGSATLRPRRGPELRLTAGQSVQFASSGVKAGPTTMSPVDLGDAVAALVEPSKATPPAATEGGLRALLTDWRLWLALGVAALVGLALVGGLVLALGGGRKPRRRR